MTNHLVFGYGRFNPPTRGHEKVATLMAHLADQHGADPVLCVSTRRDKNNPLHGTEKLSFVKRAFPSIHCVVASPQMQTIFHVLRFFNKTHNYTRLTMVVGADRQDTFTNLLSKYNGKDFEFEEWEVFSAGNRNNHTESATYLRQVATIGDFEEFREGLPELLRDDLDVATQVYELTRKGLGL